MDAALRSLPGWDRLTKVECERLAGSLRIPGFTMTHVGQCSQGAATRHVAFFRYRDGTDFALLPGGTIELGYDASHLVQLDEAGCESWEQSVASYGFPELEEHLRAVLLPSRAASLPPLLAETVARPIDRIIDTYDHAALEAALKESGFRLLSSDEWEHACAAGTRSVWRWGDTCPSDEEPYGAVRFAELRKPNAFGLAITQNPYEWEYVAEQGRMRGGDGGDAVCGGYGHVVAWLALASAYVWPMFDGNSYLDEGFVRRALAID